MERQIWETNFRKQNATFVDYPRFTELDVFREVAHMKQGKSCADDMLVVEMLQELSYTQRVTLADLYTARARGDMAAPSWHQLVATLLCKVPVVTKPSELRPITLMPVLQKVYSRLLLSKAGPKSAHQSEHMFGFRKQYQIAELLQCVQQIREKSRAWNLPLFLLKADVKKAFDQVSHTALWAALLHKGVDEGVARATMREYLNNHISFRLPDGTIFEPVPITCGTKQGDPLSPLLFTAVLDMILEPLMQKQAAQSLKAENKENPKKCLRHQTDCTAN